MHYIIKEKTKIEYNAGDVSSLADNVFFSASITICIFMTKVYYPACLSLS